MTYVLRFTEVLTPGNEAGYWMDARSRGYAWLVTANRHYAKTWKTREAAERNAARYSSENYFFEVEET